MTFSDREIILRYFAEQMQTEPMSIEALAGYFGVGWRKMRTILNAMPDVEKIDSLYRVRVWRMPPRYHQEQKLSFPPCEFLPNPASRNDHN